MTRLLLAALSALSLAAASAAQETELSPELAELRQALVDLHAFGQQMREQRQVPPDPGDLSPVEFDIFVDVMMELMAEEVSRRTDAQPARSDEEMLRLMDQRMAERGLLLSDRYRDMVQMGLDDPALDVVAASAAPPLRMSPEAALSDDVWADDYAAREQRALGLPADVQPLSGEDYDRLWQIVYALFDEEMLRRMAGETPRADEALQAEFERRVAEAGLDWPHEAISFAALRESDFMYFPDERPSFGDSLFAAPAELPGAPAEETEQSYARQLATSVFGAFLPGIGPETRRPPAFQTPQERLAERLDGLAEAEDAAAAAPLVDEIQALWADSGSDTVALLMDRGRAAAAAGDWEVASRMFAHVTGLAPDYAEGWMASATAASSLQDWRFALESLNNALIREPRRFDAYLAIGSLFERAEEFDLALDAYESALAIHPHYEPALDGRARIEAARRGRSL